MYVPQRLFINKLCLIKLNKNKVYEKTKYGSLYLGVEMLSEPWLLESNILFIDVTLGFNMNSPCATIFRRYNQICQQKCSP